MCKLLLGIKLNDKIDPNGKLVLRELLNAQLPGFESQRDGASAIVIDPKNNYLIHRSLKDYKSVFDHLFHNLEPAQLFGLHTRISTSGAVDNTNTHFFEKDGLVFAHNGIVSGYATQYHYAGGYQPGKNWWEKDKKKMPEPEEIDGETSMLDMLYPPEAEAKDEIVEIARTTVELQVSRLQQIIQSCAKCNPSDIEAACQDHVSDWMELEGWSQLLRTGNVGRIRVISNKQARKRLKGAIPADSKTMTVWTREVETTTTEIAKVEEDKEEEGKPCDSKQFFHNLPAELTKESIATFAKEKGFSGVATLIDTVNKKLWVINTRKAYIHSDFKSWLVIYSYSPTSRLNIWREFMNLLVETKETIDVEDNELAEGVHEIPYLAIQ